MKSLVLTLLTLSLWAQVDPLFDRQWYITNDGSPLAIRSSDIDVDLVPGVAGADVGLVQENFTPTRDVIIAVIDSGIDINHPDLIRNIAISPDECRNQIAYETCLEEQEDDNICHRQYANLDANGNRHPLDCFGWNIVGESLPMSRAQGNYKIVDRIGHGTHIAGTIAATANNGIGIRGVNPHAKILPVQINGASNQRELGPGETNIDVIAKGIVYAVRTGAHIINMSLGWDLNEDSQMMRRALELAEQQGVIIVAAAGNSSHDDVTYPCSYPQVLCVGSHDHRDQLSSFSNFGTSVDILAPGDNILSLWPMELRPRRYTEGQGYEFLDGTSYAAPVVAASLGLLYQKGYDLMSAKAILLKSAREQSTRGTMARRGSVDLKEILSREVSDVKLLYPRQKAPALIDWDQVDKKVTFKVQNLGSDLVSTELKFSYQDNEWVFSESNWTQGEEKSFEIDLSHFNFVASDLYFNLDIQSSDYTDQYTLHAKAIRVITPERVLRLSDFSHLPITNAPSEDFQVFLVKHYPESNATPLFLTYRTVNNRPMVGLIKKKNENELEFMRELSLPVENPQILGVTAIHENGDFKIVLTYIDLQSTEDIRPTKFLILDANFELIRNSFSERNTYANDITVMPSKVLWRQIDDLPTPVWVNRGPLPEDQRPVATAWSPAPPVLSRFRVYTFKDQKIHALEFSDKDTEAISILPKVDDPFSFWILAANGNGFFKRYNIYQYDPTQSEDLEFVTDININPYYNLVGLRSVTLTADKNLLYLSNNLGGLRYSTWSMNNEEAKLTSNYLIVDNPLAHILSVKEDLLWYQTRYRLGVQFPNGETLETPSKVKPDIRPHELLNDEESLYLTAKETPSLTSEVLTLEENQIIRLARFSFFSTAGCKELGQQVIEAQNTFLFYCEDEQGQKSIHSMTF